MAFSICALVRVAVKCLMHMEHYNSAGATYVDESQVEPKHNDGQLSGVWGQRSLLNVYFPHSSVSDSRSTHAAG